MKTILLNDGNSIPTVGFGVFLIPADGSTYNAVKEALHAGYRHIDTAAAYLNETEVGNAVRDSGLSRKDIFVTSKLWIQDYGYEAARAGIEASLRKLNMDYIDLYLLHQPYGDVPGAWKALEEAQKEGKLKSIGVSNMTPGLWKSFVPQFSTLPAVNQVECNPFFQQRELLFQRSGLFGGVEAEDVLFRVDAQRLQDLSAGIAAHLLHHLSIDRHF